MSGGATIRVNLPSASYDVLVRPRLLGQAGDWIKSRLGASKAAVVTDSHVGPIHGNALTDSLTAAGIEPIVATIPAGEKHKNMHHLMPVYDLFLGAKIERTTPVVALGGGVVTDMAGMVAATILRGVPLIQIPTSLLAMVDASIGGKTGVDHAVGKNLIGAFYQPMGVLIDPHTLGSLPPRELRSGLAECIKHDLIRDAEGFARLEAAIDPIVKVEIAAISELIAHNVQIKAKVVEADPLEKGERAHLNFGHTFGHAIESVSNFSYSHGESIALGMIAAAFVSQKLGMLDGPSGGRIRSILDRAGLPTGGLKLEADRVVEAMQFDKKVKNGRIRLVLLKRIGEATVRDDVPPELMREAVASLRG
ncbi:MAG: 3-dehydroquinate synthase [Tepidisphaeraceae bacterium]